MAPTTLNLTIMAAEDLKNVSTFGKSDLYTVAWVDPTMKRSTRVVHKAGRNPVWNDSVSLSLENCYPNSYLTVQIFSEANLGLGDKVVGTARLAVQEIYRLTSSAEGEPALATLQLQRPSGRAQGLVRLSMTLIGERAPALPDHYADKSQEPVEGIPVMGIPVGDPYSGVQNYYGGGGTTSIGYPSLSADSSSSGSSVRTPYVYQGYPYPAAPPQALLYQGPYSYIQPPQPQRSSTSAGGLLLGLLGGAVGGLILGDIFT